MIVSKIGIPVSNSSIKANSFAVQNRSKLTCKELFFDEHDVIVSKTDLKGIITYANDVFINISGYSESELLGSPHSILRHPAMPRSMFKLLWLNIAAGTEVFVYVINRTRSGDHYWVFAHVTPTVDSTGKISGYHSNRRVAEPSAVAKISSVYAAMIEEEKSCADTEKGMENSLKILTDFVAETGLDYSEFILSI